MLSPNTLVPKTPEGLTCVNSGSWEKRLKIARELREKVLAERAAKKTKDKKYTDSGESSLTTFPDLAASSLPLSRVVYEPKALEPTEVEFRSPEPQELDKPMQLRAVHKGGLLVGAVLLYAAMVLGFVLFG